MFYKKLYGKAFLEDGASIVALWFTLGPKETTRGPLKMNAEPLVNFKLIQINLFVSQGRL